MLDIDAVAVEADGGEPFRFSRGDEHFEMKTLMQLDWRDQQEVLFGNDTERRLRILLGDEGFERFTTRPLSTARLIYLIDQWYDHQGVDKGESRASSGSSGSTAGRSRPTSPATTA